MFHFMQTLFKLLQRKLRRPTFLCFSSQINIPHAYYLCSLLVFTWMVLGKKFCNVYQGHFRFGDYPDLICYRKQEILVKNVDFFLESPQICIYARHSVLQCCNEILLFICILLGTHLVRKNLRNGILFPKLFWPTMRKTFEIRGGRQVSLEQFIRTVKGQYNF